MPVYRRETRVEAPLEVVWDFYSSLEGLEALTPGFLGLRVVSVEGPDGEPGADELLPGTRIRLSMEPFGVGPRRTWVSVITEREGGERSAHFRDRMEEGPFAEWDHTHRFYAEGDETIVVDRVRYRLPGGPLGELAGGFGDFGFEPMFRYRHRRTRELLEGDGERIEPRG